MARNSGQYHAVAFGKSGDYRDRSFPTLAKAKAAIADWKTEGLFDRYAIWHGVGFAGQITTPPVWESD